ncbi:MAG: LD-carboxypeptidase [Synergistaceae bacterium]|nr:LD-carboxypeptidase [Synergistaceae bacterium]
MKKFLCTLIILLFAGTLEASNALKPGDCIGVLAPATCANLEDFADSIKLLESHGYRVKLAPSATSQYEIFAGTDRKRAEDINNFFADDEIKAIVCVKGGYGSARILGRLNYKMIAKHPKIFVGFSDITALHAVFNEKCNMSTFHGPMLVSFTNPNLDSKYTRENFFAGLTRTTPIGEIPMPEGVKLETLAAGQAEGKIIGGNLTIIASLIGTPYEINGKGALLFIEEVGEKPYRIDRMMNQLWQNGLLKRVNGIILGEFKNCGNPEDSDFTVEQIFKHYALLSHKPVIKNVPAGHGNYNFFLPLGVHAIMNANKDGSASLVIDSPALK